MKPIKTWGMSMNFANILDHFPELQRRFLRSHFRASRFRASRSWTLARQEPADAPWPGMGYALSAAEAEAWAKLIRIGTACYTTCKGTLQVPLALLNFINLVSKALL